MSALFRHLRVHQIFGANTDVGKTILTTALVGASAQRGKNVFYLKPVSTGPLDEADDLHVTRYTKKYGGSIRAECLFRYEEPVSPHLAVKIQNDESMVPSDETFVSAIANRIRQHAHKCSISSHMYVETAGGVLSPVLSGTSQADCYRPLFLPTLLVGDSRLGGISATISSYESLVLRGYIIDAVLLFHDDYYRNGEYLKPYFAERGTYLAAVAPPPKQLPDPVENFNVTEQYYNSIMCSDNMRKIVEHLECRHHRRIEELESLPRRALDTIWWPFVQHGLIKGENNVIAIDSAHSDFFNVVNKTLLDNSSSKASILCPLFDGSASWWTQVLGHSNPSLTLAAAKASGRYGHVMFPQAIHRPALELAEKLLKDGPGKGWASRAFFSDNGSTGVEVALKMALRAYSIRHSNELTKKAKSQLGVLGLRGSYHGDTIGAMDACEEGVYTCEWHNAKGYWLDPPTVGIKDGEVMITLPNSFGIVSQQAKSLPWIYNVEERLQTPLARSYRNFLVHTLDFLKGNGQHLAALILEPLVMGAGGMLFVDPLFQRVLVDTIRNRSSRDPKTWFGMPVIFDEVFTGLNRVGVQSSGPLLGVNPDIAVYAKALTGGLVPLAVTLTSHSIFEAFLTDKKSDALLHGHSYTAHPVGCEVANETLALMEKVSLSDDWALSKARWTEKSGCDSPAWSLWDPDFVKAVSNLGPVQEVMTLGSVLTIRVRDPAGGYTSHSAQLLFQALGQLTQPKYGTSAAPVGVPFGVHYRTLGNVAYFMTSLNTRASVIRSLEDKIWHTLATVK